jgi:hypothetical protein
MNPKNSNAEDLGSAAQNRAALEKLVQGIIPADAADEGASSVQAGARLAEKIENGINASVYRQGLATARDLALKNYGRDLSGLNAGEIHDLLAALRERLPGFFKQLRMDVSALYLSDPAVWARIGFPGPAIDEGGYPDFDQAQAAPGGKPGPKN